MKTEETGYPSTFWGWFYFPSLEHPKTRWWSVGWFLWFSLTYLICFIPHPYNPWGYVENQYIPGWGGIPAFMCLSYALLAIRIVSMLLYYRSARLHGVFDEKAGDTQ